MKCPTDEATLVMSDRNGIEIDYCPTCRGVWLDRGELDKIIERSISQSAPSPQHDEQFKERPSKRQYYDDDHDDFSRHGGKGYQKKRRKESFLGDLFDF